MLPFIDIPFEYAAGILGNSPDQLKLIFSFLLSYPLASALNRIPDNKPTTKNVFNIAIGLFYLVGLFDLWSGLATLIIDSVAIYLIAAYISGPYMPWLGFVWLMGHMSISHITREFVDQDPDAIDITGAQMVFVMKLSSFCWHVWDGRQKQSELTQEQKERVVDSIPSVIDYAGFIAFFPSLLVGPCLDFMDYYRWLYGLSDLAPIADSKKAPTKKRNIPGRRSTAMFKLAGGLLWLVAYVIFAPKYNKELLLGNKYIAVSFPRRIFYLQMLSFVERFKYYAIWSLTEGACILSGIGYNGVDPKTGQAKWDRLTNIQPWGVEFAQNSYAFLGNWNINANQWLRTCIYLRVTPKGKKPGFQASMATFVTSAVWHGFAPGYYVSFVLASFVQNLAKNGRRLLRPLVMTPDGRSPTQNKRYYDFLTYAVTQLTYGFVTAPFILLSLSNVNRVWSRVYYYPIIGIALCNAFLMSPGRKILQRKVKARSTARPDLKRNDTQNSTDEPTLGIPSEPSREIEQMTQEIIDNIRQRRGPLRAVDPAELRQMVNQTLDAKLEGLDAKNGMAR